LIVFDKNNTLTLKYFENDINLALVYCHKWISDEGEWIKNVEKNINREILKLKGEINLMKRKTLDLN